MCIVEGKSKWQPCLPRLASVSLFQLLFPLIVSNQKLLEPSVEVALKPHVHGRLCQVPTWLPRVRMAEGSRAGRVRVPTIQRHAAQR